MTTNGLQGEDLSREREELVRCAKSLIDAAYSDTMHLGDVVSAIRTNQDLLKLLGDRIWKKFEQQKKKQSINNGQ